MKLVYYNFCPFSRALRIALIEREIPFSLDLLNPWESMQQDITISSVGAIPVIYDEIHGNKFSIMSANSSYEYLEDAYNDISLYGEEVLIRSEVRRLTSWFDCDFFDNISSKLINEKIVKRLKDTAFPDSKSIREAYSYLPYHLEYIDFLTGNRKWLAGDNFSMADIVAGAHLSILDYLGDIEWNSYPNLKEWYIKLKSRPSFQELLDNKIGNIPASSSYRDLDF